MTKYRMKVWTYLFFALALSNCGYTLQGTRNALFEKEKIQKLYIAPLINNTYKPGAENIVYNKLVKTLAAGHKVALVQDPNDADAVLKGTVLTAVYGTAATADASQLFPAGKIPNAPIGPANIAVATEYAATLGCTFSLERRNPKPGEKVQIWTSDFARSKGFLANNQIGTFGTTGPLINESGFERALQDLAEGVSSDLQETMLVAF